MVVQEVPLPWEQSVSNITLDTPTHTHSYSTWTDIGLLRKGDSRVLQTLYPLRDSSRTSVTNRSLSTQQQTTQPQHVVLCTLKGSYTAILPTHSMHFLSGQELLATWLQKNPIDKGVLGRGSRRSWLNSWEVHSIAKWTALQWHLFLANWAILISLGIWYTQT